MGRESFSSRHDLLLQRRGGEQCPAVEPVIDPDVVAFARELLEAIAEDVYVRGRHHAAARRHLAKLDASTQKLLSAKDFKNALA
jgi:hypothetical protein